jgi:Rps23 Pro-64 3,4-dihydroxylase Tpa1-like proline 4-hydroxylase
MAAEDKIKTVKNFLSAEDAGKIINYIDRNVSDSVPWMSDGSSPNFVYLENRFYKRRFGQDDEMRSYRPEKSITRLEDIEDMTKDIVHRAKQSIKDLYKDENTQYLTSLWLAKHLKGDFLRLHSDVGDDYQQHFSYSSILYLNTVDDGGELFFPTIEVSIKPSVGDLVIFPSHNVDMVHQIKITNQERYTIPMWFTKDSTREVLFK